MDINTCLELNKYIDIPLIYYTHIPPIVLSLVLAVYLRVRSNDSVLSRIFFYFILIFDIWLACDLATWILGNYYLIAYFWSLFDYLNVMFFILGLYFVSYLALGKDVHPGWKMAGLAATIPPLLFVAAGSSFNNFDLVACEGSATSSALDLYKNIIELVVVLGLIAITAWSFFKRRREFKQILLVTGSMLLFFATFTITDYISVQTDVYEIGLYGLLVTPIFFALMVYSIARFQTFNAKVLGSQLLVFALIGLIASQYFFVRTLTNRALVTLTLVLAIFFGYTLIQSARREVKQRERIELLAKDLEEANKQQITLIHFITHQLKGFVAKSRNIFSMIQEGDYGTLPATMKPIIDEGFKSATKGAQTIQDILNASNIKSGKVAYAREPFDFKALVNGIVVTLKPNADAKGVMFNVSAPDSPVMFTGDRMQMENAIKNMIDNTIKYTPSGSITITLTNDNNLIRFITKDTGVGITPEDMEHLFTEGGHGAESRKVNVDSTGFGLYIVKNIVEAHKGKVWAESEGKGKGSTFIVELPTSAS